MFFVSPEMPSKTFVWFKKNFLITLRSDRSNDRDHSTHVRTYYWITIWYKYHRDELMHTWDRFLESCSYRNACINWCPDALILGDPEVTAKILKITQPSQYRYELQYRFAVTSGSPSIHTDAHTSVIQSIVYQKTLTCLWSFVYFYTVNQLWKLSNLLGRKVLSKCLNSLSVLI